MSAATIGILIALAASISWAFGSIFIRLGIDRVGATTSTFISIVAGFVYVLAVTLIVDARAVLDIPLSTVLGFVVVGMLSFVGGRLLYYTSVSLIGIGRATAMGGAVPIVSSLLAVLFLGELLTLPLALGIGAVVAGVALIVSGD